MSHEEDENKVVVSNYTISNIERFFEHFEIKMNPDLQNSINTYKANPGNFSQEEVTKLCNNICKGWMEAVKVQKHELLVDEVFTNLTAKINEKYEAVRLQEMIETSLQDQAEENTDV